MRRTYLIIGCLTTAACAAACKARNPEDAGLLSSAAAAQAPIAEPPPAAGGDFQVTCRPSDSTDSRVFTFAVSGAVSPSDESQPLVISVTEAHGSVQTLAASAEQGHGVLSGTAGSFLAFPSGVLTTEPAAVPQGQESEQVGLLTLARQVDVSGVRVSCQIAAAVAHGAT